MEANAPSSSQEKGIAVPGSRFLLPFEVTSILILVALIGAIVLARKEIN